MPRRHVSERFQHRLLDAGMLAFEVHQEALDALTSQLSPDEGGMLVVIQRLRPDRFFTAAQQQRLADLMSQWRIARDAGGSLAPDEQIELQSLVEAELEAAGRRAERTVREIER